MKFKNVKLNQEFIYNDLIYTKKTNSTAFNDKLGEFTIYENEKVKPLYKTKLRELITSIFTFIFGCMIGLIIFWIVNKCN